MQSNQALEERAQQLEAHLASLREAHENALQAKNREIAQIEEESTKAFEVEIHNIKESCRSQVLEIKEEYAAKAKAHQDKADALENENERVKKELCKNKNFEEVKALHQKLEKLRKQSFDELISIKKERDDMFTKVQFLEKELSKAKRKMRATQNEVSKNRELKQDKAKFDNEFQMEVQLYKNQVSQCKALLNAAEAGERRLKEQLLHKEAEFEEERNELRDKISREKKQTIKYQEL